MYKNYEELMSKLELYVGCTGFNYPEWRGVGRFYPPSIRQQELLAYYSTVFPLCELNTTFYAIPSIETTRRWSRNLPEDFVITAKIPKLISHSENIAAHPKTLAEFLEAIQPLEKNLGPLVLQLPPSFDNNAEKWQQVIDFFTTFPHEKFKLATEFRHRSWFTKETFETLNEYGVGIVSSYLPYIDFRLFNEVNQPYYYVRLIGSQKQQFGHGKELVNRDAQLITLLETMKQKIQEAESPKTTAYVNLNNHFSGYAPVTAKKLMEFAKGYNWLEVKEPKIKSFKGQKRLTEYFG